VPIHVDNLLIVSNSKGVLARIKAQLATQFKIHDQGLTKSILGIKIKQD
jgi:hypothetical protein